MSEAEDRDRQGRAARGPSPPQTSGDPFHWDGMGPASQGVACIPVSALVTRAALLAAVATASCASPAVPTGSRDLLPVPPALTSAWDTEAAALSWYLDPGLLLATASNAIPGATGELVWVPQPHTIALPTPMVHRVLLVHTVDEALPVAYMELVLHLPLHDPLHHHIVLVLQAESEAKGEAGQLYAQALADALVVHFLRRYAAAQPSLREVAGGFAPFTLRRTLAYIQEHLEDALSLATLAAVAQISPMHFAHLFKQATGQTPHRYVLRCRMAQAKRLLAETDVPLSAIAWQVGCADQSHFTALFRQHVATTPKAYRDATTKA